MVGGGRLRPKCCHVLKIARHISFVTCKRRRVRKFWDLYRFDAVSYKDSILNVENWGQGYYMKKVGVLTNLDLRRCEDPIHSRRPFTLNVVRGSASYLLRPKPIHDQARYGHFWQPPIGPHLLAVGCLLYYVRTCTMSWPLFLLSRTPINIWGL